MNALKVIQYSTSVSPANLNLNDTTHFVGTHAIEVTNSGTVPMTYQITHETGITIQTKGDKSAWVSTSPPYVDGAGNVAEAEFSTESLTIPGGSSATFSVTFTEPSVLDPLYLPVYGGAIILTGENSEQIRITYMGRSSPV